MGSFVSESSLDPKDGSEDPRFNLEPFHTWGLPGDEAPQPWGESLHGGTHRIYGPRPCQGQADVAPQPLSLLAVHHATKHQTGPA